MNVREVIEVPAVPAVDAGVPAWAQNTSVAVLLAIAVSVLWRTVAKVLSESRDHNKQLVEAQGKAQAEQTKAVIDLKDAVQKMDTANQVGLANVVASLSHQTARVDRHEAKLDAHDVAINALDRRLTVVETEK